MRSQDLSIDVHSPPISIRTRRRRDSSHYSDPRHERRSKDRARSSSRQRSSSKPNKFADSSSNNPGSRSGSNSRERSSSRSRTRERSRSQSREGKKSLNQSRNRRSSHSKTRREHRSESPLQPYSEGQRAHRSVSSSRSANKTRSNSDRLSHSGDYRNTRPSKRDRNSEREAFHESRELDREELRRSRRQSQGYHRRPNSPFSPQNDTVEYQKPLQISPLSTGSRSRGILRWISPRKESYLNKSFYDSGKERSPHRRSMNPFSDGSDGFRRSPFSPKGQHSQQLSPNTIWSEAYQSTTTFSPARDSHTRIKIDENHNSDLIGKYTCKPDVWDDGTVNGYEVENLDGYDIDPARSENSDETPETFRGESHRSITSSLMEGIQEATKKGRPICLVATVASAVAVAAFIFVILWLNSNQSSGSQGNSLNDTFVPTATPVASQPPINVLAADIQDTDEQPSSFPSSLPSYSPTLKRTNHPTLSPSNAPSSAPSAAPSFGSDPYCNNGIRSAVFCCHPSCGTCGGDDCATRNGGESNCCTGNIVQSYRDCSSVGPPCVITSNIFSR